MAKEKGIDAAGNFNTYPRRKKLRKIRKNMRQNIIQGTFFLLFCFFLMLFHLFYVQAFANFGSSGENAAPTGGDILRGSILDAEGRALAQSTESNVRSFPMGEAMAPVTGYFSPKIGSFALESYLNRELWGMTEEIESLGPVAQLLRESKGNDAILTIDADAQQAAYDAFMGRKGAAVVLDVDSGAVLALVSSPSFNPNFIEGDWDSVLENPASPLLNRALAGLYPPGSTIKPLIADIALATESTDLHEVFECTGKLDLPGGHVIGESHNEVHGRVHLDQALAISCNVTFGTLAMRMGAEKLASGFNRFGFDKNASGEIAEAQSSLPEWESLDKGDIAQVGLGQSTLLVTPLKMALLAEAIAGGGQVKKPYMVQKIVSPGGLTLKEAKPEVWYEATTKERAEKIDAWMESVVQKGTGTSAKVPGIRVTGKTGTAENVGGADHAWFIGSATLKNRRIAFAVIVENGGSGGKEAAPIAKQIILSLDK